MSSILICDICKKPLEVGQTSTPTKIQIGSEIYEQEDTCPKCVKLLRSILNKDVSEYHEKVFSQEYEEEEEVNQEQTTTEQQIDIQEKGVTKRFDVIKRKKE